MRTEEIGKEAGVQKDRLELRWFYRGLDTRLVKKEELLKEAKIVFYFTAFWWT